MRSYAKYCWYNKEKGVSKSKYGNEVNISHEDSDGFETMVLMDVVSDEGLDYKTWFLDTSC